MRPDHMGPLEHQRDCPHGSDRNHCRLCDLERENARLLSGMKREQARADMAEADKAELERVIESKAGIQTDLLRKWNRQRGRIAKLDRDHQRYRLIRMHVPPVDLEQKLRLPHRDLDKGECIAARIDELLDDALYGTDREADQS